MTIPDKNWVRMAKCRFCGHTTNALLLSSKMKEIKEEEAYLPDPCDKCKKRFKDHKYFIGDCGHSGFIKTEALKRLNPEAFKSIKNNNIFRMKKCFMCEGIIDSKDAKRI